MKQPEYITIADFANRIGLSRVQIFRRVKSGQIKAERFGRAYLIPIEELQKITGEISELDHGLINKGVKKTLKDYGSVIKDLGEE
ncbi:MAG: excisionase family DNA-binding protein [Candidatus Berkelbacteria bacterium]|nr:excisionase family DNA-binding protein [Candidatus Berkelbacteria bacterium]